MKRHRTQRHLDRLIRSVKDEYGLPPGLTDRVEHAVAGARQESAPRRPVWTRGLVFGAAALVVCALVAAAVFGRQGTNQGTRPPAPTAARGTGLQPVPAPPGAAKTEGDDELKGTPVAGSRTGEEAGQVATTAAGPKPLAGHRPQPVAAAPVDQQLVAVVAVQQPAKAASGRMLAVGDRLPAGSVLRTGAGGRLTVVTRHGSEFTLAAASELALSADGRSSTLRRGHLYCRNRQHELTAIATSAGRIELLGTVVDAAVNDSRQVVVTVVEGRVRLANAHGQSVVNAGRRALLMAQRPPTDGAPVNVAAETAWYDGRGGMVSASGQIAYVVSRTPGLFEVWVMNDDGSGKRRVRSYIGTPVDAGQWLPGEQKVLVTSDPPEGAGEADAELWRITQLLDVATGQDGEVTFGMPSLPLALGSARVAVSPDGGRAAFAACFPEEGVPAEDWDGGLYIFDLRTAEMIKRSSDPYESPSWSPDGHRVVVSRPHAGGSELAMVNVDDGSITGLGVEGTDGAFSPDGTRLAYVAGGLYVWGPRDTRRPLPAAGPRAHDPQWSPGGDRVLYEVTDSEGAESLGVAAADGSWAVMVYVGASAAESWAPSGDAIFVRATDRVLKVAADGSGVIADLGGNEADSPLGEYAQQTEAAATEVERAMSWYSLGKLRVLEGRTTEARAAYRMASDIFSGLLWRYPLAGLGPSEAAYYADRAAAPAAQEEGQVQPSTCRLHLGYIAHILRWYAEAHRGDYPPDLATAQAWVAGQDVALDGWAMSRPEVRAAVFRCPEGGSYTYTPPAPAGDGQVVVNCARHPSVCVVSDHGSLQSPAEGSIEHSRDD